MEGDHAAGGSAGLAELIDKHGEEIYFDLHHYAGLNLVDALRDGSGYSPRQLLALIRQLPLESATVAALRGGSQFRGWGLDRYISSQMVDALQENTYVTAATSGALKRKPKPPKPSYRPNKDEGKKKGNMFSSMAQAFYRAATTKPKE